MKLCSFAALLSGAVAGALVYSSNTIISGIADYPSPTPVSILPEATVAIDNAHSSRNNNFRGTVFNKGMLYVGDTEGADRMGVIFNSAVYNSGTMVLNANNETVGSQFLFMSNLITNSGTLIMTGAGSGNTMLVQNAYTNSNGIVNDGVMAFYQQPYKTRGIAYFGFAGNSAVNTGTVCIKYIDMFQRASLTGTGCFDVGFNSTFYYQYLIWPISINQVIYLSTNTSRILLNPGNQINPLTVAGWGNGNIIGFTSTISSFILNGPTLTLVSGSFVHRFNIGLGYEPNSIRIVNSDLFTGEVAFKGYVFYDRPAPSTTTPCRACPEVPLMLVERTVPSSSPSSSVVSSSEFSSSALYSDSSTSTSSSISSDSILVSPSTTSSGISTSSTSESISLSSSSETSTASFSDSSSSSTFFSLASTSSPSFSSIINSETRIELNSNSSSISSQFSSSSMDSSSSVSPQPGSVSSSTSGLAINTVSSLEKDPSDTTTSLASSSSNFSSRWSNSTIVSTDDTKSIDAGVTAKTASTSDLTTRASSRAILSSKPESGSIIQGESSQVSSDATAIPRGKSSGTASTSAAPKDSNASSVVTKSGLGSDHGNGEVFVTVDCSPTSTGSSLSGSETNHSKTTPSTTDSETTAPQTASFKSSASKATTSTISTSSTSVPPTVSAFQNVAQKRRFTLSLLLIPIALAAI